MQEAINIQDTRTDAKTMVETVIKEAREDAVNENQWKIEMNNSTEWNLNLADKDEEYVKQRIENEKREMAQKMSLQKSRSTPSYFPENDEEQRNQVAEVLVDINKD